jgi:hypothetical protein
MDTRKPSTQGAPACRCFAAGAAAAAAAADEEGSGDDGLWRRRGSIDAHFLRIKHKNKQIDAHHHRMVDLPAGGVLAFVGLLHRLSGRRLARQQGCDATRWAGWSHADDAHTHANGRRGCCGPTQIVSCKLDGGRAITRPATSASS